MTAGNQPTLASLNSQAGAIALSWRNDAQTTLWFNEYLSAIGGAAFLESLAMTTADANTVISGIGNLAVVANAYQGNGLIAATFNYMANSEPLWGGL